MKQSCSYLLLLAVCLFTGCESSSTVTKEATETASAETTASSESEIPANHFVIDVRSKDEWDSGHLETAVHIPHTEIVEGIKNVTDDKNAKIYLH